MARAIVTGLTNLERKRDTGKWTESQVKNGFNKSRKLQLTEARKSHEESGVPIRSTHGNTFEDAKVFAEHLCEICILDRNHKFDITFLYKPKSFDVSELRVYLLMNDNHFDVITSMTGFMATNYDCHVCKKGYAKRGKHRCPYNCPACLSVTTDCDESNLIECNECNMTFYGDKFIDILKETKNIILTLCVIVSDVVRIVERFLTQ